MGKRGYKQFCGLAKALDVLGERWTLLIVRELLLGPRRYTDLLDELPGITTNLLAKRLQEMEKAGLVEKRDDGDWALLPAGAALEPSIMELARWGGRYLDKPRPGDRLDIGWGLLSLKRRYLGGRARRVGLEIQGAATGGKGRAKAARTFILEMQPQKLVILERDLYGADLVLRASVDGIRALWWMGADATALQKSGALEVVGATELLDDTLAAFGPPRMAHEPRPAALA